MGGYQDILILETIDISQDAWPQKFYGVYLMYIIVLLLISLHNRPNGYVSDNVMNQDLLANINKCHAG